MITLMLSIGLMAVAFCNFMALFYMNTKVNLIRDALAVHEHRVANLAKIGLEQAKLTDRILGLMETIERRSLPRC